MSAYKKTRITIETEQILIIRRRAGARRWCRECGREVDMVGFAQACVLTGMAQSQLRNYARSEKWHLAKAADGSQLICLDSLLNSVQHRDPSNDESKSN